MEETIENGLVIADVFGAKNAMKLFNQLKEQLLDKNDIVIIQNKPYIKRSGWRKIALAFNLKTEILKIEREQINDTFIVRAIARAIAPNGRYADEAGICDSKEFEKGNLKFSFHNVETKAITRAVNRAISDLVGGGEVSAEEIIQGPDEIDDKKEEFQENSKNINVKDTKNKIDNFLREKGLKNETEANEENKTIKIYGDIPNEFFNELREKLKKENYGYMGRLVQGGSIWKYGVVQNEK